MHSARMMRAWRIRNATRQGIDQNSVSSIALRCGTRAPGAASTRGRKATPTGAPRPHPQIARKGRSRAGLTARQRVENAAIKRYQRHQQKIGKCDPRELDREREAPRIFGEAWGEKL